MPPAPSPRPRRPPLAGADGRRARLHLWRSRGADEPLRQRAARARRRQRAIACSRSPDASRSCTSPRSARSRTRASSARSSRPSARSRSAQRLHRGDARVLVTTDALYQKQDRRAARAPARSCSTCLLADADDDRRPTDVARLPKLMAAASPRVHDSADRSRGHGAAALHQRHDRACRRARSTSTRRC